MKPLLPLLLTLVSVGCAESANNVVSVPSDGIVTVTAATTTVRRQGLTYQRLTGSKLRDAIAGNTMSLDPDGGIVTSSYPIWFHSDGHQYWRNRDRVGPRMGTYDLSDDQVCYYHEAGERSCFALFKSASGKNLISTMGAQSWHWMVIIMPGIPFD